MGCSSSIAQTINNPGAFSTTSSVNSRATQVWAIPDFDQTKTLSPDQKRLVKQTWTFILKDLPGNGLKLFLRIFEICPEVQKLFHVDDIRPAQLVQDRVIKEHRVRIMKAVGSAIDSLDEDDDDDTIMDNIMRALGQQHRKYGRLEPSYYTAFYQAFMWNWEEILGEQFTPKVAESWSNLMINILNKIKKGYDEYYDRTEQDDDRVALLSLSSTSPTVFTKSNGRYRCSDSNQI